MSENVSKKVEEYVRSSTFFIRLCEKIYDKKLDKDGKGLVPILKVTMAMPVMFQKFQTKLFDKIGVKIGCPTYKETVKILMMHDKNKDRMISREEFEGVAISMLYIAAANFFQSFMEVYMTSILLGILLTQAVTQTLVVNCAVTVQWLLELVPTFGGLFIPSLLLQVPALVFGSALGAVIRLRILKHLDESSVEEEEEDQSLKDDKDEDEPPKLKMKDFLKGFTEIRKGIFNERKEKIKSLFCKPSVSEEDAAPLYDALASDSRKGLLNEEVLDALSVATTAQQKAETGTSLHPSSLSTAAHVSQRLMGNRFKNDAQDMLGCENKPDGKKGIGPFKGPIAQFVKGKLNKE